MNKSAIAGVLTLAIAPGLLSVACNRSNQSTEAPSARTEPAAAPAKTPVTDSWITVKIQAQYFADPAVKGRNIDVTSNNGAVMLMGRVESEQARQRAVEIAKQTDGVSRVDDHLVVGAESQAPQSASSEVSRVGNRIASGWITTKIQAQYFADPTVKGHDIDVDSVNGVVTLNGVVDSEMAHERAVALAKQTEGVKDVEDHLMVQAATAERRPIGGGVITALTDTEITARIQSKYFVDDDVKARDVDVDTSNGVVTLSGTVDSERAHREAVRLARRTPGVADVRDQLKVEKAVATSGRRDSGTSLADKIEDAWITTKIQSRYWIDERVKGHNIDVTTKNGVVTLAGEVNSQGARQQALDLARDTDGVTRVVDQLKIKPVTKSETKSTTRD
jgi:hyperosmotically inducible periplasmic protein